MPYERISGSTRFTSNLVPCQLPTSFRHHGVGVCLLSDSMNWFWVTVKTLHIGAKLLHHLCVESHSGLIKQGKQWLLMADCVALKVWGSNVQLSYLKPQEIDGKELRKWNLEFEFVSLVCFSIESFDCAGWLCVLISYFQRDALGS